MQIVSPKKKLRQPQAQALPGIEAKIKPETVSDDVQKQGSNKLARKIAFITGGDSGIGKAVAILFAKEGAGIAMVYMDEHTDAKDAAEIITGVYKRNCLLIAGDLSEEKFCQDAVKKTIKKYGRIDILIKRQNVIKDPYWYDVQVSDTTILPRAAVLLVQ